MGRMKKKKAGKFVVQRHEKQGRPVHWDLMLENHGVLETYRVKIPPEKWIDDAIEAVRIFDHPLKFLTYQGSVNNGKGRVTIADSGTYRILSQDENRLKADFAGTIIKGEKEIICATGGYRARRE